MDLFILVLPHGVLRFFYQQLNKVTILQKYPLPWLEDYFNLLQIEGILSIIDIRSCYNQMNIRHDDVPKKLFWTRYGHYEFLIVSFWLTNMHGTFIIIIYWVFKLLLNLFGIVFVDHILVYLESEENHVDHIYII